MQRRRNLPSHFPENGDPMGKATRKIEEALRSRLIGATGTFVSIQTVSLIAPGEKCDYKAFGEALKQEAAKRGLVVGPIGEEEGNFIVRMPKEDITKQTLLLVVHSDTMPAGDRSVWDSDPYKLRVEGDKMFGRGASDDISGIVIGLEAMHDLMLKGNSNANVRMLVSRDEETGSEKGLVYLAEKGLIKADAALVLDAESKIVTSGSGVLGGTVQFSGSAQTAMGMLRDFLAYSAEREKVQSKVYRVTDAPREFVWGRATPTILEMQFEEGGQMSLKSAQGGIKTNAIPSSCTLCFHVRDKTEWTDHVKAIGWILNEGFSVKSDSVGSLEIIGQGGHAGYPHTAKNPVLEGMRLIEKLNKGKLVSMRFGFDLRAIPEEDLGKLKAELIAVLKKSAGREAAALSLNDSSWSMHHPCLLSSNHASRQLVEQAKSAFEMHGMDKHEYGCLGGLDASTTIALGIPTISTGALDAACNIHAPNEYVSISLMGKFVRVVSSIASNWKDLKA
jgi:acetylornithine deacetylase/succinyl-diaminopimelate desuccinylase-like protein